MALTWLTVALNVCRRFYCKSLVRFDEASHLQESELDDTIVELQDQMLAVIAVKEVVLIESFQLLQR